MILGACDQSIDFGTTSPGQGFFVMHAFFEEVGTTFTMDILSVVFVGFRVTRPYVPMIFLVLYSIIAPVGSCFPDKDESCPELLAVCPNRCMGGGFIGQCQS